MFPIATDVNPCCLNQTGMKTKLSIVVATLGVHIFVGCLFNISSEDYNIKYHYPNLGSCCFILAATLFSLTRCLHPKSLCFPNEFVHTMYISIAVPLIANLLLVLVWHLIINVMGELVALVHDLLLVLGLPRFSIYTAGCANYYICHVAALLILGWVLYTMTMRTADHSGSDGSPYEYATRSPLSPWNSSSEENDDSSLLASATKSIDSYFSLWSYPDEDKDLDSSGE